MNIKISPNLVLTIGWNEKVTKKETVEDAPVHRIIIYDRSGSMWGVLKDVTDDICQLVDAFSTKDILSIGWFSGEGEFRFMCKGLSCSNKGAIKDTVKKNATTVGMTCFSEIATDAVSVAEEIRNFNPNLPAMLTFLTDGNPVVSNYAREMANLKKALTQLGTMVESAVFIGYGSWYNRETLSNMATWTGGSFVHAANMNDVRHVYTKYNVNAQVEKRFPYTLPKLKNPPIAVFALQKGAISLFNAEERIISTPAGSLVGILHDDTSLSQQRDTFETAIIDDMMYAAALAASQVSRSDAAIEILGALGDVGLAQLLTNCITQDEVGHAEKWLSTAVEGKERYVQGKQVGCVPAENATSVFQILEVLADGDAKFYPYHKEFSYKRTGLKSSVADGYSKFTPDKSVACSISGLVFHSSRLNASIQVTIPGTIDLGDAGEKVGLARTFPTKQIRTFTVIKDGRLNVTHIPVSVSRRTWEELWKMGVVDSAYEPNTIQVIALSDFPVMNRAMAKKYLSAHLLGRLAIRELMLEADLKAIKAELEKYDTTPEPTAFQTAEQIQCLLDAGISEKGIYSPPTVTGEKEDVYEARGVEVVIKGLASLPSVNAVKKKLSDGKSLTRGERIISNAMDWLAGLTQPVHDRLEFLQGIEKEVKAELRQVRYDMAKSRAAVILGGRWFTELGSRNNTMFKYEDYEIEFKDRLERVAY